MEKSAPRSMSVEPLDFNKVTSVKLPRSVGYIYNNLISYNDIVNNISYYAIINGVEVWIIKHFEPEKLRKNECKDVKAPSIELRKVPFDKLESISAVKWCNFNNNSMITFVICTEFGKIYIYDFEGKKLLYSHNINDTNDTNNDNMTINCIESNNGNLLFVGLSCGSLLSFNLNDNGLSNKKLIFQFTNNEAINCISKPVISKNKDNHSNNKIYIGCDDGSVIQYDFYSSDIDILIDKSNVHKIMNENSNDNNYNNCGSCICISSCDDFVVAGYSSGFIKIVEKSELSFVIKQIAMHRRMVTSVDILQECLVATVSEDGYFHILRNTTSSLDVIRSGYFQNSMLIGCKFIKTNHYPLYHQKSKDKILLITAYDRNRLAFV